MMVVLISMIRCPSKEAFKMTDYIAIPGYEGIYEASSNGTIWTCEGKTTHRKLKNGQLQKRVWKRRQLMPKKERRNRSKHFDLRVELWKNGNHKTKLVSRLVASAFIANPDNKPAINHIDGNSLNNKPENLEWCTFRENNRHAIRTGLNNHSIKIKLKGADNGFEKRFCSMSEASKWLGFNDHYVSGLLNRGITHVGEYEIIVGG